MSIEPPWLAPQIAQLRRARLGARFPSALLIHDQRGAGGDWLARYAAQLALCRDQAPACGRCRDCRLFLAAQHPDYIWLSPIEDSKQIRIEQVRELVEQLALTAHGGGATVAVIAPADALNISAANALLKTLEEPRAGVSLILVAGVPSRLPATILSRCQKLRIAAPSRAESLQWLEREHGAGPWAAVLDVIGNAPLQAAQLDAAEVAAMAAEIFDALNELAQGGQEISRLAERWARAEGFELRLACIETWLTSSIDRGARGVCQSPEMRTGAHLPESGWDMNIAALLRVQQGAYELRSLRLTSINRSVALEQLLWQLLRAMRRAAS